LRGETYFFVEIVTQNTNVIVFLAINVEQKLFFELAPFVFSEKRRVCILKKVNVD